jgi:AcrR family transcriptional regulator
MAPRFDVSTIRRDQILRAAGELFAERGVADVRLEEIAARLDVSKAALYLYYPGKDAILAAVITQYAAQLRRELEAALFGDAEPFQKLLAAVAALQSPAMPVRLRSEIIGLSCTSEAVAAAVRAQHRTTMEQLTRFFGDLAQEGQLANAQPDVAARRVLYLSEGILLVRSTIDAPDTVAAETYAILSAFAASYLPGAHTHAERAAH